MSGMARPLDRRSDPTSVHLRRLAEQECRRFQRRNLRSGPQRRVHAVEFRDWLGGMAQLPAPACHQPMGGFVFDGHAEAVAQPVDCERCRALPESVQARLTVVDGGQLTLALEAT